MCQPPWTDIVKEKLHALLCALFRNKGHAAYSILCPVNIGGGIRGVCVLVSMFTNFPCGRRSGRCRGVQARGGVSVLGISHIRGHNQASGVRWGRFLGAWGMWGAGT